MGGADNAHVDLAHALTSHRTHLPVLKHSKKLGLHRERHLADLVEQKSPTVGNVEQARAGGGGARECTPHVPEQRRLEKRLGHARAVLADERPPRPRPVGVHGARDELLACAALADDEDRHVARGHPVDQVQELAHRLAAAGDLVVAIARLAIVAHELELRAGRVELRRRAREDFLEPDAARSARRAARRSSTASRASAMAMAACDATTRTHASSRGPKAPFRRAIVEVHDSERLAARHERHGEHAAQASACTLACTSPSVEKASVATTASPSSIARRAMVCERASCARRDRDAPGCGRRAGPGARRAREARAARARRRSTAPSCRAPARAAGRSRSRPTRASERWPRAARPAPARSRRPPVDRGSGPTRRTRATAEVPAGVP
jgi:hypothetical protein